MSWWLRHIGWWPPLLGAGVKLTRLDKDLREADVEMRLTRWNKNYVGVHFGGSLFSMTDPFYMLMLAANLGEEYVVWDKAASIRYRKPGKGRVRAEFRLTEEKLAEIRAAVEADGRYDVRFLVEIKDEEGGVVAMVERVIYCATKMRMRRGQSCGVVVDEFFGGSHAESTGFRTADGRSYWGACDSAGLAKGTGGGCGGWARVLRDDVDAEEVGQL